MHKFGSTIGLRFDNSYARLPKVMMSKVPPSPVKSPHLLLFNKDLSDEIDLNFTKIKKNEMAKIFSGNGLPVGSEYIAQAYAGHQFGHFTMLGDGRALLMGEHVDKKGRRFDIQLKGSGLTPYSRNGDGRAALGPVLREYVISEYMHSAGIPSTRSLSVVSTGENVFRETPLPGAVLSRVASSHIRVGTFQYIGMLGNIPVLKRFVDYVVRRHYPKIKPGKKRALDLFRAVMLDQIKLVSEWMRVGFVHGVMNTDNMSIAGETIDYGPCAFLDYYNPKTVFSSIDHGGRYSYENQPSIAYWNLLRFAETLLPLIDNNQKKAVGAAQDVASTFASEYKKVWIKMMGNKLGLIKEESGDEKLIFSLLDLMHKKNLDYTNTFISLSNEMFYKNEWLGDPELSSWWEAWSKRLGLNKGFKKDSLSLMCSSNPLVIPRNHKIEEALQLATNYGDLTKIKKLIKFLNKPYKTQLGLIEYQLPPKPNEAAYKTFCGT